MSASVSTPRSDRAPFSLGFVSGRGDVSFGTRRREARRGVVMGWRRETGGREETGRNRGLSFALGLFVTPSHPQRTRALDATETHNPRPAKGKKKRGKRTQTPPRRGAPPKRGASMRRACAREQAFGRRAQKPQKRGKRTQTPPRRGTPPKRGASMRRACARGLWTKGKQKQRGRAAAGPLKPPDRSGHRTARRCKHRRAACRGRRCCRSIEQHRRPRRSPGRSGSWPRSPTTRPCRRR